ncbi:MAG: hypothetical protein M0P31_08280 [Solirubrobacteraceae bacterium]|nr:hypothetical protein [Solirubrobacteraceae bacterium]
MRRPGTIGRALTLGVTLAAVAGVPATAGAEVRQGEAGFAAGPVEHAAVSFDRAAGAITVTLRMRTPQDAGGERYVNVRSDCALADGERGTDPEVAVRVEPRSGAGTSLPPFVDAAPFAWNEATRTTAAVLRPPTAAGADLRCVEIDGQGAFWFDGFEPLRPADARALVRADLRKRGGERYAKARVVCPASPPALGTPHVLLCRTHLRIGRSASIAEYRVDSTRRPIVVKRVSERRYRVAVRRCRISGDGTINTQPNRRYQSTRWVGGRFDCRDAAISDAIRRMVMRYPRPMPRRVTVDVSEPVEDGEVAARYPALDRMRCRAVSERRRRDGRRGYRLRCSNRVGDRFEARVTVGYVRGSAVRARHGAGGDDATGFGTAPRPAVLLLAASRRPVMQAHYRYQGDTGQDLDPRKGTYIGGYLGLYTDSRKRIHGAELTYRCPGQRHPRRTVLSAENVPGFEPVKVRNRKIRLRWTAGWYHNSTGGDARGTNVVTVRADLYRRQPAQRSTPRRDRIYYLAKGTVRVVDGSCKVRTRVVIHRSGRQKDPGLGES